MYIPSSIPQAGGLPIVRGPNCLFHTCTRKDHSNLDAGHSPNKTGVRISDQNTWSSTLTVPDKTGKVAPQMHDWQITGLITTVLNSNLCPFLERVFILVLLMKLRYQNQSRRSYWRRTSLLHSRRYNTKPSRDFCTLISIQLILTSSG